MKTFTSSKTIKRMLLVLLVCSLITGTLTACGSKKKQSGITTFTVGFDAEYPPYGYMDDNGEYTGFVVRKKIIANISSTYEELVQAVESSEK